MKPPLPVEPYTPVTVVLVERYEVLGEVDQNEGRGMTRHLGFTDSREEAETLAQGQGVMGHPGTIRPCHGVMFPDGSIYALDQRIDALWSNLEGRTKALAKLTPAERRLLGLE